MMKKTEIMILLAAACIALGACRGGNGSKNSIAETTTAYEELSEEETAAGSEEGEALETAEEVGIEVSQGQEDTAEEAVFLEPAVEAPEGMALYESCPFFYEDEEWQLQMFAQEDMVIDGELALDDRCSFLIRIERPEGTYTLFSDTVQLGVPSADIWIDTENKLHIVIQDIRTARYQITDYVYDKEQDGFLGRNVLAGDGINYAGSVGKTGF